MKIIIGLVAVIALSGCADRQAYNAIKHNKEQQCRLLQEPDYSDCMNEVNDKSYEEYEDDLKSLHEESPVPTE
ncbi:hypothetical protein [Echinimonas agarilytica]|uniref:Lipoprotein n=1 Tax=Echinimonas agarilytica TaxID=1215918 RepID=A0AA41W610_9GAMM|nr:hypothetical protein [Echinimonas agarilytica]MCM2679385.1 hypothetical protein [Echinimonas agarilytica]